jgi:RNA polymerase sigma-70 factor (ECF subfamily)
VDEGDFLAKQFEQHRGHLRAVAYRMLGSLSEAEDAVQEAWLRLGRTDASGVENLGGWLTTVVARICLDQLRARKTRGEEPIDTHVPDPIIVREHDPAAATLLADSIGLALLVVLDLLAPAERLAFVLHDMFGMPFDEIAAIVGRTPEATRQLASRARRRVQGAATPDGGYTAQRAAVDAFLTASRAGDFAGLIAILDPEVVLRTDRGAGTRLTIHGAENVAKGSLLYSKTAPADRFEEHALVNGAPGLVVFAGGQPASVLGFTVARGKIIEIDILADPVRLGRLSLSYTSTRRPPSTG